MKIIGLSFIREPLTFIRQNTRFFRDDYWLYLTLLTLSLVFSALEGLSITMLFPLLQNPDVVSIDIPFVKDVAALFSGMSLSDRIITVSSALAGILILRGGIQFLVLALITILPNRVKRRMSLAAYSGMVNADVRFIASRKTTEHVASILNFPAGTSSVIKSLLQIASSFLVLTVYVVLAISISTELTVITLGVLGMTILAIKRATDRPISNASRKANEWVLQTNFHTYESVGGATLLRLREAAAKMTDKMSDFLLAYDQQDIRRNIWISVPRVSLPAAAGLFVCGMLIIGAKSQPGVSDEWLASVVLFIVILFRVLSPISEISTAYSQLVGISDHIVRYVDYAERSSKMTSVWGKRLIVPEEIFPISFRDVTYAYHGNESAVLNGISFEIPAMSRIALVGPSGGGKSTIVKILAGLYQIDGGSLTAGNINFTDIDPASWRTKIGYVEQDPFFFNDSIRNNMSFGLSQCEESDIWAALNSAAADEFVKALPDGLDTEIGDRAVRLSGGQKQRLSIARELLLKPSILILDEATSHLDSMSEHIIQNTLEKLPLEINVLVVAHRLATAQHADQIVVVQDGKIAAVGKHDELVDQSPLYRRMVELQTFN